jgi:hypothetical protein
MSFFNILFVKILQKKSCFAGPFIFVYAQKSISIPTNKRIFVFKKKPVYNTKSIYRIHFLESLKVVDECCHANFDNFFRRALPTSPPRRKFNCLRIFDLSPKYFLRTTPQRIWKKKCGRASVRGDTLSDWCCLSFLLLFCIVSGFFNTFFTFILIPIDLNVPQNHFIKLIISFF